MNIRWIIESVFREAITYFSSLSIEFVRQKSRLDFVSSVDIDMQKFLIRRLHLYGDCDISVIGEEAIDSVRQIPNEYWLLDPIDGTSNLVSGIRCCGISIAYMSFGLPICGGIMDLNSGDVISAERKKGLFLNGHPYKRSDINNTGLIGVSTGAIQILEQNGFSLGELVRRYKFRNYGAQAIHLAYVSLGSLVGSLSAESKIWDDAAGRLLVEESGIEFASLRCIDKIIEVHDFMEYRGSIAGHSDFVRQFERLRY